jgi:hypothetical protein
MSFFKPIHRVLSLRKRVAQFCKEGDLDKLKGIEAEKLRPIILDWDSNPDDEDWEEVTPNPFVVACQKGHIELVSYLKETIDSPSLRESLLRSAISAQHDELEELRRDLEDETDEHKRAEIEDEILEGQEEIDRNDDRIAWLEYVKKEAWLPILFEAYLQSYRSGNFELVLTLETAIDIEQIKPDLSIYSKLYHAYRVVSISGDIELLTHLESFIESLEQNPDVMRKIQRGLVFWGKSDDDEEPESNPVRGFIAERNYLLFREVVESGTAEMAIHLMQKVPGCFNGLTLTSGNRALQPEIVNQLVDYRVELLRQACAEQPDGFDIAPSQWQQAIYLLENLINRNDERLQQDIEFLLRLPTVASHACLTIDGEDNNHLLQLALRVNNHAAQMALIAIPEVRELAAANNFYHHEIEIDETDLADIAGNRESSMRALNQAEEEIVNKVRGRYHSQLAQRGEVAGTFEAFKDLLCQRYRDNPAQLTLIDSLGNEEVIELPLERGEFVGLVESRNLTVEQVQQAMRAYYQHQEHCAYRYFLKPNPWMHPGAQFIVNNSIGMYSTFEDYLEQIALFYLAASDEAIGVVDGISPDDRLDLFIRQIALIGRAHNYDQDQVDDLGPDRPSCTWGVLRRLFQSVLGHPDFMSVTQEIAIQACNQQIKNHFDSVINIENARELLAAYNEILDYGDEMDSAVELLKSINLNPKSMLKETFAQLQVEFGDVNILWLDNVITNYLSGLQNINNPDLCVFDGKLGLVQLLQTRAEPVPPATHFGPMVTGASFFAAIDESDEEANEETKDNTPSPPGSGGR